MFNIASKFVKLIVLILIALQIFCTMKLSDLGVGQQATIIDFSKDEISIKLMEMGLVPGEVIYIEKFAPLGDPISVAVAGYSLSLRLNEAENITVEVLY